ncbi:MAG TPA: zinc ribbon domain-containing protein [Chromatiaceae bacterium]|jgi:putative FmdB family regulatory protein|nr:MAG: hypothetical protein N838_29895 [Thiohalocapsa sp. PB-PSB1]QQO55026.1 MAG: zinc ribbon domain-containing protein [Thiohalocapsa sp. PB-PSB1]HBG94285.1 zinc ribbon domain-containing protein [Chromatiaceae bacterium]HCS89413.1 zinc ribbon domain-containing protein [Chromatiaceae bacterium]
MPIYAYRCENCGHDLDALQKLSDAPLTDCPACGHASLKKQITAAAFRLKGAGWYETDFKKDGKKNLHEDGEKPKESAGADKNSGKGAESERPAKPDANAKKNDQGGDTKPKAKPTSEAKPKPTASES